MNRFYYVRMNQLRKEYRKERRRKSVMRKLTWAVLAGMAVGVSLAVVTAMTEPREAVAAPHTEHRAVIRTISIAAAGVPIETAQVLATVPETVEETTAPDRKSLGAFTLTAYCNCRKCCGKWAGGPTKSGTMPQAGRTIAVDPRVIPLGTHVYIEGFGEYIAEDTGSAIKGNHIDIYMDSHNEARWFANGAGSCKAEVYLINE